MVFNGRNRGRVIFDTVIVSWSYASGRNCCRRNYRTKQIDCFKITIDGVGRNNVSRFIDTSGSIYAGHDYKVTRTRYTIPVRIETSHFIKRYTPFLHISDIVVTDIKEIKMIQTGKCDVGDFCEAVSAQSQKVQFM